MKKIYRKLTCREILTIIRQLEIMLPAMRKESDFLEFGITTQDGTKFCSLLIKEQKKETND